MPDPLPAASRPRLAWRCRRGMKELDLLLAGWLERQFERASEAERCQFAALLELPDPEIAGYLLRRQRPQPAALAALVDSILAGASIMSSGLPGGNLR
jgi:antitoxin CptB